MFLYTNVYLHNDAPTRDMLSASKIRLKTILVLWFRWRPQLLVKMKTQTTSQRWRMRQPSKRNRNKKSIKEKRKPAYTERYRIRKCFLYKYSLSAVKLYFIFTINITKRICKRTERESERWDREFKRRQDARLDHLQNKNEREFIRGMLIWQAQMW